MKTTKQILIELENPNLSEDEVIALMNDLVDLDPYNDIFHLGCPNWPNCDFFGCGEE